MPLSHMYIGKSLARLLCFIFLFLFILVPNGRAQNYTDSLDLKLQKFHKGFGLSGFAAAIVNMNGVLYQNAHGFANLETKQKYTTETIQCIASTSKTTIALAVMKLQEEDKLNLDSPINEFLPFKIKHPQHKDSIIRIKHLVTHTSGIIDTENNYDSRCYYFTEKTNLDGLELEKEDMDWLEGLKENTSLTLEEYFRNVFHKKGDWFDDSSFSDKPFASHYEYSNVGAGLMAYIIEQVVGQSFDSYIKENVFDSLDMTNTSFHEDSVDTLRLAKSYVTPKMVSLPYMGFINYPDGGIHTNCEDLSTYLIEMIKGYNGQSELLNNTSFKKMMSPLLSEEIAATNSEQKSFNNIGVFWQMDDDGTIKHYGGNPLGGACYFSFDPKTNIGRILLTNCDPRAKRKSLVEFISVWRTLGKYAMLLAEE